MERQMPMEADLNQKKCSKVGVSDPQSPLLELRSLRKKFGDIEVLKDISLSVRPSEVVAIVGTSGSGKSTLLRCINLLEEPTGGEIFLAGQYVYPSGTNARGFRRADLRKNIGMVFQSFNLWPHMTVIENVIEGPIYVMGIPRKEATCAVYIPFLKLADQGVFNDTLMKIIRANSRLPDETEGDVFALAASNDIGVRRLSEMMEEFGLTSLDELSDHIIRFSREAVIAEIAKLPKGVYRTKKRIDAYENEVDLVATLTISSDGIRVDYDGTSPCSRFGINVPLSYATAYTCFGLACLVAPWVPNNSGSLQPYTVTAPPGSILNPQYPAAVAARANIGLILPDVVFGCLAQAVPDRVPAEGASSLWSLNAHGPRPRGNDGPATYTTSSVLNGGAGARPTKDGLSVTAFPSGVRCSPVEITEAEVPVTIWRKEYRPDSGGAGRYRGGLGLIVEVETNDGSPFELRGTFEHRTYPPCGRSGGRSGAPGYLGLASGIELKGKGREYISGKERVILMTPGGGGFGAPADRERGAVLSDVRDGLVTPGATHRDYGVDISPDDIHKTKDRIFCKLGLAQ